MRVDLYRPAATIEAPGQASQERSASIAGPHRGVAGDVTTLSPASASIGSLVTQAAQQDPSRIVKVEALKQQVNRGSYPLDSGSIANALVAHYI